MGSLAENWSEQDHLRKTVKEEGKCYSASGDGKIPWVSKFDIAACAVHALTVDKSVDGDLIILGPELLSYSDVSVSSDSLKHMSAQA